MDDREDAFDEFFRRYHRSLFGIALALVGNSEAARDIAQEAMMRAFRDWAHVCQLDRPDMWTRRVALNLAIDERRRRARVLRAAHRSRSSPAAPAVGSAAESSELWEAVRALPERQRAAIVLRYVEDLPLGDIATVLDVTEGTVKASLSHARVSLARQLTQVYSDG